MTVAGIQGNCCNAEEEPENPDYPKDPRFRARFGPRGVLKCRASDKDDPTEDPAFGWVGKQVIENTGPMGKKRMETVDEEFLDAAKDYIKRKHAEGGPWFCYFNSTRMHVFTHLKPESQGKTGLGVYPDGMVEHDGHVGQLLDLIDELGVAADTIVVYTTDNGAEVFTWPDGGATPFRGEKATNWEGGFRVPCMIRWPGVIEAGTIVNNLCAHEDFIPTFAAAAGETGLVDKLKAGGELNGHKFKVHLDGHDLGPFLSGKADKSPREGFFYWSDDGDLLALRVRHMKLTFMEQHGEVSAQNPLGAWQSQFTQLRVPNMFDLRADPFERATTSIYYADWQVRHVFYQVPAQAIVARMLETCKEFPPRAKAASFTVSDAIDRDGKPKPELTALQQMGLCPTVMLWTALHHPREHNSC